ncbi:MAG: hypothetical protein WCA46_19775 [Actinocatenispora sp.]
MVRTLTALTRLLDVVTMLETDPRVQIVFTTDSASTAIFRRGVDDFLSGLGAAAITWDQATRTHFDLVIAASENDRLEQLDGPVLLVPHGLGFQKYYPGGRVVAGMDPARLLHNGRPVPAAIALSHPQQRDLLESSCPQAASRAVIVGDPSLDRLLASRHRRHVYRTDLHTRQRFLVLIASTWGPDSLLGRLPRLPDRVATALPVDEYRVAVVLHPGVWAAHGPWQVRAWLGRARGHGVHLVPPQGWEGALTAADVVVSDHGSVALYAAALGKPLLLSGGDGESTVADSAAARLAVLAKRLDLNGDVHAQIDGALRGHDVGAWASVTRQGVDGPGTCAGRLRPLLYRMLRLADPADEPTFPPAESVVGPTPAAQALVVGMLDDRDAVSLARFPAAQDDGDAHVGLAFRHLVVDVDRASVRELGAASILCVTLDSARPRDFVGRADGLLAQWPNARMVAGRVDEATCWVRLPDRLVTARMPSAPVDADPLALASVVSILDCRSLSLAGRTTLRLGDQVTPVELEVDSTEPGSTPPWDVQR